MDKPAEKAKPGTNTAPIFLNEKRIREGVEFWPAHRAALDRASASTGVAPEYLIGDPRRGDLLRPPDRHYRVLDALATLAFDYPAARQILPAASSSSSSC